MTALIKRINDRIENASYHDRCYEKPMDWDEAEQLMGYINDLEKELNLAIQNLHNLQDEIMMKKMED